MGLCCFCFYLLLLNPVHCKSSAALRHPKARSAPKPKIDRNSNDTIGNTARRSLSSIIIGKVGSASTVAYGGVLMIYGRQVPAQLQALTVLRIAGFPRLQQAVKDLEQNIRQTKLAVLRNGPSLLLAQDSLSHLNQRAFEVRQVMAKNRAAKADGVVTDEEERDIRKLHKRHLKSIRRDMRRIQRGSNALIRLWDTLDLDEVWELFEDVLFMTTAVLASGNDNFVGRVFAKYCYFMNIGSLLLDASKKNGYPLSRFVLRLFPFFPTSTDKGMEKDLFEVTRATSLLFNYAIAAYLVCFRFDEGITLNSALMVALIILGGTERLLSRAIVDGPNGGVWMLSVTLVALSCSGLVHRRNLLIPSWMGSLGMIEDVVSNVVQATRLAGKLG
jgi:hypothetical protein